MVSIILPQRAAVLAVGLVLTGAFDARSSDSAPAVTLFLQAAGRDDKEAGKALAEIARGWKNGYAALIIDLARFMRPARRPSSEGPGFEAAPSPENDEGGTPGTDPFQGSSTPTHPSSIVRGRLIRFLEKQTGQRFGDDLHRWREWMWNQPYDPHPDYAAFKGHVYAQIDPGFAEFFRETARASIRLDEIDWGGITVNGIPPLEYPRHVPAADAGYLKDDHVVFGVYSKGIARAYPKRILAWHELARDRIGSLELTLVYCTLCGTVIPYDSNVGGTVRTFGTSGLLYRSNKLMFDAETRSLWSSIDGTPVVGPLAGSGLRLTLLPVVTTTWGEWKRSHPQTTVLSIETGFKRDYSEGAAYRQYFATDRLMFNVPRTDPRLKNKAEVLVFRLAGPERAALQPVAISAELLRRRTVYHPDLGEHQLVIITSPEGANRVYRSGPHRFSVAGKDGRLVDANGRSWAIEEDHLQAEFDAALRLPRIPASRAFWFGWYAQYPDTILVK